MSFSVNTNNNAMAALRTLSQTNSSMTQVQSRINTGMAVAGAKDNASTFAIAQGMRGDIAGLKAVQSTLQLGETTVNTALKGAEDIFKKLETMKEKVVEGQSANRDSAAIQRDLDAIAESITGIANAAQFNGVNLLNSAPGANDLKVLSSLNRTGANSVTVDYQTIQSGDLRAASLGVGALNIQQGYGKFELDSTADLADTKVFEFQMDDANGTAVTYTFALHDVANANPTLPQQSATQRSIMVDFDATDSTLVRLDKMAQAMNKEGFTATLNSTTGALEVRGARDITAATSDATGATATDEGADPSAALTAIETAINTMKGHVARLGTNANQLTTQKDFVKSLSDSLVSGVGSLVDADLAEESARLQALQTKQQLGIQALSIANQGPGAVLSLFR